MKTSLYVILSILEQFKPSVRIPCKENSFIDAVNFLEANQKAFTPNILYLGKASDFSISSEINSPINVILVADYPLKLENVDNDMLNIIILNNYYDLQILYREIFDYLKCQQDFLQKSLALYECLVSCKGLKSLVDCAGEILGNPVAIWDMDFNMLAHSQHGIVDEPLWNEAIKKGFIPYETILLGKKSVNMKGVLNGDSPEILHVPYMKHRFLCWVISISGEVIGYITILESARDFDKTDKELLRLLCNLVSIELQKSRKNKHANGVPFENLISDLLNERLCSKELLEERLKNLGLKFRENLSVSVLKFRTDSPMNAALHYVRDALERLIGSSKCAIYGNQIIMLISNSKQASISEDEIKNLNRFLKEKQMVAGISRSFSDIINTKHYYTQAYKAIEYGKKLDMKKYTYFYEDYSEFHLLDMAAVSFDIKEICNPMLLKLLKYDRINNCDLVKSLYLYLSCGNSLTKTAEKIGMHRNSMDYRIKKIEEIINADLNDPNLAFSLNLSIKIMQFIEGKDFYEYHKDCSKAIC